MNYQKTINLPKTAFSMRAGLSEKEPRMLAAWETEGVYQELRQQAKGKTPFVLHDGPPYANGHIHIGHALNKILKDFIVKMKTMQGFDAEYVPGWDCHGLPIEHQLFKELKKRKSEVSTVEFRKKAYEYALKFVGIQREEFKRLGIFGEWEKPYLTLSKGYEFWILQSFARLVDLGYVYRGLKPVNWCPTCETALAEAEVEYEDHTSPSVYVKFLVKNPDVIKGLSSSKSVSLLIWTTTPWTLLANVAVAVHHSFQYSFVDCGEEVLIIESSLRDGVLEKAGHAGKVLLELKGDELKNLIYEHPFGAKDQCRVITVDYVTREDGTGLVHTAPGHGQEDYEAGLEHGLDILMPVDDRGIFTKDGHPFEGQHVFKANANIVENLSSRGLLFHLQEIVHSYPHCWRCKRPIIFRATHQWFLAVDHENLRGKLKDVIKREVEWIPEAGQERILSMVSTRPDWCLSRQRHWGVPIPALACQGCGGEHKLYSEVVHHFAHLVKKSGTDVWFEKNVSEFLPKGFVCPDCNGKDFEKTHDILDVWFDSGVSHQAVIGPMLGRELPADLYLEGSDQHRGWFQSSLIPSVAMDQRAPFKAVLTHGFVVDGQGRKMSKSLGNVISPQEVIKNNGVDILRLWVASSNYNEDIRLSKEILDRLIDAYRKIRNTVRYLLGNLNGYDPAQHELPYEQLLEIDQWALNKLAVVVGEIKENYNRYEFAKVYKLIYSFCNEDLSGFYLDILKDRLYTSATYSVERRSAQTVLYHILNHFVRLLAPILSFTSDEIFSLMPKGPDLAGAKGVHFLAWLDCPQTWKNPEVEKKFELLTLLRPHVMKALEDMRRDGHIGSSLEAKIIFVSASERDIGYLQKIEGILPPAFIVSSIAVERVKEVDQGLSEYFSKTKIVIERADGEKCPRCWNYRRLGEDEAHPEVCGRCAEAVKEMGFVSAAALEDTA